MSDEKTNESGVSVKKKELPTLADLYKIDNIEEAFKLDQFNLLLNQEPDPKWIHVNKYAGNSKYVPISIQETLLQRIFKGFTVEVLREGTMFNAVYVTVRLHYIHPVTGEAKFQDGVGADQLQTASGASPSDLSKLNSNAVAMSLPKAKSLAISDATDHLGKIFGRDLNRDKLMTFGVDNALDKETILSNLFEDKKYIIPANEFDNVRRVIDNQEKTSYDKMIKYLKTL